MKNRHLALSLPALPKGESIAAAFLIPQFCTTSVHLSFQTIIPAPQGKKEVRGEAECSRLLFVWERNLTFLAEE